MVKVRVQSGGPSHNPHHLVCVTRRLINSDNFATSAALAEGCALLSVILV